MTLLDSPLLPFGTSMKNWIFKKLYISPLNTLPSFFMIIFIAASTADKTKNLKGNTL